MSRNRTMAATYDPAAVERTWSARWDEAGLFRADADSGRPRRSMALSPPNVTGELHAGHAMYTVVEDVRARFWRMTGHEVLWLPGTDHAAIATQNVIERQLAAEGTSLAELGRERFRARVDEWYATVGHAIVDQLRELGASLDASRHRFTMDPAYVRAVRTAFRHLWDRGWIYRGPRIVNWCPRCRSAISDLEVEWQEHRDVLYRIRYPIAGESDDAIVVATVRPETLLADTGVAVHPDDDRQRRLVGRQAVLPLVGRLLPIVADPAIDRAFGTGALKVTPGHGDVDWEIGMRHGLDVVDGLRPDGRLRCPELPRYDGLTVPEARELVVQDLATAGALAGSEPYDHQVGHCDRCGAVIEPLVSEQWFVRMGPMAEAALAAAGRGEPRWQPERHARTTTDWLRGIRDWCISRQLWLGHAIPVSTCDSGHRFAWIEEPEACPTCGSRALTPDPDVLDTWFSAALWPFATLGWPDDAPDLRAFYPTTMVATDRGILNLWISRMVMCGLELTGRVPFAGVAVTCTLLMPDGRRMSKSRGVAVDPRALVLRYGADAVRAWVASVAMAAQDVRFDETRIEGYRRFANKLWNASRLVLGALDDTEPAPAAPGGPLEDRWLLSRLQVVIADATASYEANAPHAALAALHDFAWHDLCDRYLEAVKPRLRAGDPAARATSLHVLATVLRLLHPVVPFVTEELWHHLPGDRVPLVRSRWPVADDRFADPEAESLAAWAIALAGEVRRARLATGAPRRGGVLAAEAGARPPLDSGAWELAAELAGLRLVEGGPASVNGSGLPLPEFAALVHLPAGRGGAVAPGAATGAARDRLVRELERTKARLADAAFVERAPAAVVARERMRRDELAAALERLTGAP